MVIKLLGSSEIVGGHTRAYWTERYFKWFTKILASPKANPNDQQGGVVWFARGRYTHGFEGVGQKALIERYELPRFTFFFVPAIKIINTTADNDACDEEQLLALTRTQADLRNVHKISLSFGDGKAMNTLSYNREDYNEGAKNSLNPIDCYVETRQFSHALSRGYGFGKPEHNAVAAAYAFMFGFTEAKDYEIKIDIDFEYNFAQRHERYTASDEYDVTISPDENRYTTWGGGTSTAY